MTRRFVIKNKWLKKDGAVDLFKKVLTGAICGLITFIFLLLLIWAGLVRAAETEPDKTFLWRVKSPSTTAYVLGSIHLATPKLYPLPRRIEESFDRADILAVEVNINAVDQIKVQEWLAVNGFYPENRSLEQNLSAKTKAGLARLEIDIQALNRLRPWLAAITLQARQLKTLGFDEAYGVDKHFLDKAEKTKKPIRELESILYQLTCFSGLSEKNQELFLSVTLAEWNNMAVMVNKIIKAWRIGAAGRFEDIFFKQYREHPELNPVAEKLIFQRNAAMAAQIEDFLASGKTYFVIVGAGHLVGKRGVIHVLKTKGHKVEQL